MLARRHPDFPDSAGGRADNFGFHLHGLHDDDSLACFDLLAGLYEHLPEIAGEGRAHQFASFRGQFILHRWRLGLGFGGDHILPGCGPAFAFLLECLPLGDAETGDGVGVLIEEVEIVAQFKSGFLNLELESTEREVFAKLEQLLRAYRIEANLVKETQQPRLPAREVLGLPPGVPHLNGASHKLVAARTSMP